MNELLRAANALLISAKIDLSAIFRSMLELPRYLSDRRKYIRLENENRWSMRTYPILLDRNLESASLGEYFWQDLFVAKKIIKQNPARHIDIGSRIDGFIGHLACVRGVEIFDIRPLTPTIDHVKFTQWDITNPNPDFQGISDCVTCLHTLEHIGLGRYGDQLDPDGWKKGLNSLVDLLSPGGCLWLSVPIGIQRVEFNAHRIFKPATIIDASEDLGMKLSRFFYLTDSGIDESEKIPDDIEMLSREKYGLGIFLFIKGENE